MARVCYEATQRKSLRFRGRRHPADLWFSNVMRSQDSIKERGRTRRHLFWRLASAVQTNDTMLNEQSQNNCTMKCLKTPEDYSISSTEKRPTFSWLKFPANGWDIERCQRCIISDHCGGPQCQPRIHPSNSGKSVFSRSRIPFEKEWVIQKHHSPGATFFDGFFAADFLFWSFMILQQLKKGYYLNLLELYLLALTE